MTNTLRNLILLVVLAATGAIGVGVGASLPDTEPPTARIAEPPARIDPSDIGRSRPSLDGMQLEIARIEDLGLRIARWPGTDNDPLLDQLVAERLEAILSLVDGDRDVAFATLGHVSGGMGVVEAVESAWQGDLRQVSS